VGAIGGHHGAIGDSGGPRGLTATCGAMGGHKGPQQVTMGFRVPKEDTGGYESFIVTSVAFIVYFRVKI
jgi:hypothetical protein